MKKDEETGLVPVQLTAETAEIAEIILD